MYSDSNDWKDVAIALSKPIKETTEFISLITKPSAKEWGEIFATKVRYWRIKNGISIMKKTKKLLEDNKINPKIISLKLFVPILESSTLEEEEFMQDKWSALLTNAVNPNYGEEIRPCYAEILKELAPTEVKLLDKMFEEINRRLPEKDYEELLSVESVSKFLSISEQEYYIMSDNLIRLNLCQPAPVRGMTLGEGPLKDKAATIRVKKVSYLTPLGYSFVKSCKFERDVGSIIE